MLLVFRLDHFWLGWPLLLGSLTTIGVLVYAAYLVPRDFGGPTTRYPSIGAGTVGVVGFVFFPVAFVLEYGFTSAPVPAAVIIGIELVAFGLLAELVRRGIGRERNNYLLVNLAFGFVLWQAVFGLLLTLGLPYTLPLIVVALLFFFRLRRAYAPAAGIPPGASGPLEPPEPTAVT
jgi:hypothetical protein